MYLWIFIALAVVLCGMFLVMSKDVSKDNGGSYLNMSKSNQKSEGKNEVQNNASPEKVDLTKVEVDFEEDADDLSDGIVDDAQFDETENLDSIENEVY